MPKAEKTQATPRPLTSRCNSGGQIVPPTCAAETNVRGVTSVPREISGSLRSTVANRIDNIRRGISRVENFILRSSSAGRLRDHHHSCNAQNLVPVRREPELGNGSLSKLYHGLSLDDETGGSTFKRSSFDPDQEPHCDAVQNASTSDGCRKIGASYLAYLLPYSCGRSTLFAHLTAA